jgi:ADP-ribosylglycohydrolase
MVNKEQFQGSILGAACGDALGMPTEALSYNEIQEKYGWVDNYKKPFRPRDKHRTPGQWTDDTEQLLLLTESLIESKGFIFKNYRQKMVHFAEKFIKKEIPNRGYGGTTRRAFQSLVDGLKQTGGMSPGCGSAMKMGPFGLFYANSSVKEICNYVKECSQVTHLHPESISGAYAIAVAVSTATIEKSTIEEIIGSGIDAASQIEGGIAPHLRSVIKKVENSKHSLNKTLKTGFTAKITVGISFAIICKYPNYKKAIEQAINFGGDTDSYATMIGSILGAKDGIDCIPQQWLDSLEDKEHIRSLATKLYETFLLGRGT